MKNGILFLKSLNSHLPEINNQNRNRSKESLIKKIKDNNIRKYERNIDILNHIKNWSRNISNIKSNKRNNISSNESNKINNCKLSLITHKIDKDKPNINLTINNSFKDNNKRDHNKKNIHFHNDFIKCDTIKNGNNNSLINTNHINKNIFNSIENIHNEQNNDKTKNTNNIKYSNYLSYHNTSNLVKNKNKFGISAINMGKINILPTKLSKNKNINPNILNSVLENNNKERNNQQSLYNTRYFLNNEDSIHNIMNKRKESESEKGHKRKKKKYYISHNSKKIGKNLSNISDIKYNIIFPGLMNSSTNKFKEHIFKSLENDKLLDDNSKNNKPLIKDIKNFENLNNINNFILILKHHIMIEKSLNNIYNLNGDKNNIDIIKSIIDKYNIFFNQLNDIIFELNIFIYKEYNSLLQEIIKLLIYFHCLNFIILSLYDINSSFNIIKKNYINILNKLSFCLYNIFFKFIYKDLINNKYNELSFIYTLNELYSNKYEIKSTLINNEIFSILQKNYHKSKDEFYKQLDNNNNFMNEIVLSLKNALLIINKKDLLYHIDICLNIFLYTLLEKNIQKALLNSKYSKNKYGLNSVPYLPPLSDQSKYKYTIVLDMDETLGHFISNEIKTKYYSNYGYLIFDNKNNINKNEENEDILKVGLFLIRPFAKFFLEELDKLLYEIVIFTAGTKEYCDKVLDILDINNNLIKYKLYRSHLSLRNINDDVKDLSLLGRNLSKIIMIDNLPHNYKLQQDNGLPINSWTGDINDTSLKDLLSIMKYFVEKSVIDVRDIIKKIKTQLNNDIDYSKIKL